MSGHMHDTDLAAVQNPATPPALLAEIAARRGDLHSLLLHHPACYPQLREWILAVNPAIRATMAAPAPAPVPRRGRGGLCALLGCGGIALLGFALVVVLVVAGLFASSSSPEQPEAQGTGSRSESLAAFDAERSRFYELYAQIEANPVAPLVADLMTFRRLEASISQPPVTDASVADRASEAKAIRQSLEQRIADAAARRANVSGSVSEAIVDEAGQGFIDIAWNADTECGTPGEPDDGRVTIGCISEETLTVHLLPEDQLGGDTAIRLVVLHELSHLYMRADSDANGAELGSSGVLVEQGHFQGNSEVFADCYALTYLDLWTLTFDGRDYGYNYICTAEERQLMRTWAVEVHAPMP
ncbi:variant leucine-rich repeat-containing protein [Microbacterium phyllosphaerae]